MELENSPQLEKMRRRRRRRRGPFPWVIVALVVIGLGLAFYFGLPKPPAPAPTPKAAAQPPLPPPPPPKPKPAKPVVKYPISTAQVEAAAPAAPLPFLDDSDGPVLDALSGLLGKSAVQQFLVNTGVIRNIVVTVDNLPRQKVPPRIWPVKPTPGQFQVTRKGNTITTSANNASRYWPIMRVVAAVDTTKLAELYVRYYPLFQQAYQDLGYPNGYFNDRLIEVINLLLKTPAIPGPVNLVQPSVYYKYADPGLESLSAGQKILLRLGNQNEAIVKTKLLQFRDAVLQHIPKVKSPAVPGVKPPVHGTRSPAAAAPQTQ